MRTTCQTCNINEAIWAWHPFGPADDDDHCFTTLGSHYRGFPIVKVCDECKRDIENGSPKEFEIRGKRFIGNCNRDILEVPPYVDDALLFREMN